MSEIILFQIFVTVSNKQMYHYAVPYVAVN